MTTKRSKDLSPHEHRFSTTRVIKASAEEAYAAWTDPALMRKWFGTVVEADVRIGGQYRVENHEDGKVYKHKGEYLVLEPGRRIVKTFAFDGDATSELVGDYTDETLTITFRSLGPKLTEITLVNSWNGKGMDRDEELNLKQGWDEWLDRYQRALTASVA